VNTPIIPSKDEQKSALRSLAKERRKDAVLAAGDNARDRFTANMQGLGAQIGIDASSIIAGYWAMADELDVMPALTGLSETHGARCSLPVVIKNDAPLIFRQWQPDTELESGGFGTHHPVPESPRLTPDIVLVPLLAFDKSGYRLGWGGGFYDRTLAILRSENKNVVAIGTAYAGQEMDAVVRDEYDQPVDWIVTEKSVCRVSPS